MKCLALWIVIVASVEPAAAQTITATTGAVNGIVTDSSKAVVPGVTVNLSGPALITVQTTATDEAGAYRFSAVPPGDYAMTFALSGFATVVREGVHVGLGFTASVDAELRPGGVTESVLVTGSPVIDLASTEVTAHFDSDKLAALPGARDVFAVLANTPGVAVAKMDVGGNGALAVQEYTAYGLRATSGVNRYEVEGIRTGQANGINDIYLPDFASFAEIAVKAVGHSAAIPVPGTLVQHISKSGGNVFRGSAYADFQSDAWEATNIDDDQIARGVSGGPGLDARDVNRLQRFRDFTVDAGGYLKKDKAWWYAAYRDTDVRQRYAWLLDTSGTLLARVATGKVTYNLTPRQKLVGYLQHETFEQSSWFQAGANQPLQTSDALPSLAFPVTLWKGEYNAAVTDALYVEARIGRYLAATPLTPKSTGPAHCRRRCEHRPRRRHRNRPTHQSSPGQRFLERHEGRLGREPHVPHRRRVHARTCRLPLSRLRQSMQLRVDAQQPRARAGADRCSGGTSPATTW